MDTQIPKWRRKGIIQWTHKYPNGSTNTQMETQMDPNRLKWTLK